MSLQDYNRVKLDVIHSRIEHNEKVIWVMESLLGGGKLFSLFTIFGTGVLSYNLIFRTSVPVYILLFGTLLLIAMEYALPSRYLSADNIFIRKPVYEDTFAMEFVSEED